MLVWRMKFERKKSYIKSEMEACVPENIREKKLEFVRNKRFYVLTFRKCPPE